MPITASQKAATLKLISAITDSYPLGDVNSAFIMMQDALKEGALLNERVEVRNPFSISDSYWNITAAKYAAMLQHYLAFRWMLNSDQGVDPRTMGDARQNMLHYLVLKGDYHSLIAALQDSRLKEQLPELLTGFDGVNRTPLEMALQKVCSYSVIHDSKWEVRDEGQEEWRPADNNIKDILSNWYFKKGQLPEGQQFKAVWEGNLIIVRALLASMRQFGIPLEANRKTNLTPLEMIQQDDVYEWFEVIDGKLDLDDFASYEASPEKIFIETFLFDFLKEKYSPIFLQANFGYQKLLVEYQQNLANDKLATARELKEEIEKLQQEGQKVVARVDRHSLDNKTRDLSIAQIQSISLVKTEADFKRYLEESRYYVDNKGVFDACIITLLSEVDSFLQSARALHGGQIERDAIATPVGKLAAAIKALGSIAPMGGILSILGTAMNLGNQYYLELKDERVVQLVAAAGGGEMLAKNIMVSLVALYEEEIVALDKKEAAKFGKQLAVLVGVALASKHMVVPAIQNKKDSRSTSPVKDIANQIAIILCDKVDIRSILGKQAALRIEEAKRQNNLQSETRSISYDSNGYSSSSTTPPSKGSSNGYSPPSPLTPVSSAQALTYQYGTVKSAAVVPFEPLSEKEHKKVEKEIQSYEKNKLKLLEKLQDPSKRLQKYQDKMKAVESELKNIYETLNGLESQKRSCSASSVLKAIDREMAQSKKKIAEYETARTDYRKDCQKPSSDIKELQDQIAQVDIAIGQLKGRLNPGEAYNSRPLQMKKSLF